MFLFLRPMGNYFAERKIDTIIDNYHPSKMDSLFDAAVEQMQVSGENEKQNIYDRIFEFFSDQNIGIQYEETQKLIGLISYSEDTDFINNCIDTLVMNIDTNEFYKSIKYIAESFESLESTGYMFAQQINNAVNKSSLYGCYSFLLENREKMNIYIL